MKKFIGVLVGVKSAWHLLRGNPISAFLILLLGSIVGVIGQKTVESFIAKQWPHYFDASAGQILENQRVNFEDLKTSLDMLRKDITSDEGLVVADQIRRKIDEAITENRALSSHINSLISENQRLRQDLIAQRGFDGGTDLRVSSGVALKLDSRVVIAARPALQRDVVTIDVSEHAGNSSHSLRAGQGIIIKNENNESCRVTLLGMEGERPNQIFRFSKDCIDEAST